MRFFKMAAVGGVLLALLVGLGGTNSATAVAKFNYNLVIKVNGQDVKSDVRPFIDPSTNRTYVPIRFVAEALGQNVDWDQSTKSVRITASAKKITLVINSKKVYVDGVATNIDAAPMIVDNRVMVPVRFVSEALGATVHHANEKGKAVVYITNGEAKPEEPPEGNGGDYTWTPGKHRDLADAVFPPIRIEDGYLHVKVPDLKNYNIFATYTNASKRTELEVGKEYKFKLGDKRGLFSIGAQPKGDNAIVESYAIFVDIDHPNLRGKFKDSGLDVVVFDISGSEKKVSLQAVVEGLKRLS